MSTYLTINLETKDPETGNWKVVKDNDGSSYRSIEWNLYTIFSMIANVRNSNNLRYLKDMVGIPEDSPMYRGPLQTDGLSYGTSFLTLEEAREDNLFWSTEVAMVNSETEEIVDVKKYRDIAEPFMKDVVRPMQEIADTRNLSNDDVRVILHFD